jgi:YhcH/YjgK/YiaL family protein
MIIDTLANAGRCRGLAPLLDEGLEALARLAADPPADGRHELAGPSLYASLSTYSIKSPREKLFEAHRRFIDIQVVLSGRETLYWAPLSSLETREQYSESGDIAFYAGPAGCAVPLQPGWFVVLFPQDAHMPGCLLEPAQSASQVRKLVVKVAV